MGHDGTSHPGDPGGVAAQASVQHGDLRDMTVTSEGTKLDPTSVEASTSKDPQVAASSLHFPSNISDDQPWIKFTVEEFQGPKFAPNTRQSIGSSGSSMPTRASVLTAGAPPPESTTTTKSTIKLFLPHQLNEQYGLSWAQDAVGFAGQAYETGVWNTLEDIYESGGAWEEFIGRFLSRATGTAAMKDLPLRHDKGMAINPHMESFFKGVQFRKFTYNFQMFPKNTTESTNIKEIIKVFKMSAAPRAATGIYGRYWKYPKQFNIQYSNEERTHKLKRCFLENIAVNYGAAGVNQRFKNTKAPLQTDLTLNFTELDLVQMEDIKAGY